MKHYIYISVAFLIFGLTTASFAQTGEIKGKVVDKQTKSPLPFATVRAELNGAVVAGAQVDIDGNYSIKPLAPGRYNLKAALIGYQVTLAKGILVVSDKFSEVRLELQQDSVKRYDIIH